MHYIALALLAFDKGGNPHQFKDLPFEDHNPQKPPQWSPCIFDNKDEYVQPVYLVDDRGKTYIPEPTELVRYKSYSWSLPSYRMGEGRDFNEEEVRVCIEEGSVRIVPTLLTRYLSDWDFK